MSFFPSADPDEEQAPYAESQPCFTSQSTNSFAHLVNAEPIDFSFTYATTTHGLPNPSTSVWAPAVQESLGLGLQYPSNSFVPGYSGSTAVAQPTTTSFSWHADFTPTQTPVTTMQSFRRDSCSDTCDPPPTVQPSQLWEPFRPNDTHEVHRDLSPERSEYSTSSYQSTTSSPFVHSESYATAVGSPMVKVESEPIMEHEPLFEGVPSTQESPAVKRRDFASIPGPASQHYLQPSFSSDAEDGKPGSRPDYRRESSTADTEDLQFIGRRKRSLTRPENASCSCEICGKLFQRCYNLKAHMETHDANRSIPHKCKHPGCGKRFARRTDLLRHNESVRQELMPRLL